MRRYKLTHFDSLLDNTTDVSVRQLLSSAKHIRLGLGQMLVPRDKGGAPSFSSLHRGTIAVGYLRKHWAGRESFQGCTLPR